jgi:hypothetical protein
MKAILILSILMVSMMLACSNEQTTQSHSPFSLYQIETDSNWVELTDTIDVLNEISCLSCQLIQWGVVFNSENDYHALWEKSINEYPDDVGICYGKHFNRYSPKPQYISPNIDFGNRSVLGFHYITGWPVKFNRHIFINDHLKEYLFTLDIRQPSIVNEIGSGYSQWTSIPKIKIDYSVLFDTTISKY